MKETSGYENLNIVFITNNDGISLTNIYSNIINELDSEIVIFIHDDIEFLKNGWASEVVKLFDENKDYGIIGIAGSAEFDSEAAWWRYNRKYGQVLHRKDDKSWLTMFSPLLEKDLQEVVVVDGLFIAVNKTRITTNFDTNIQGFNFYDIDFCLSNFLDKKTKIGVTTNIRVAHSSIGELKVEWYDNKEYINKKYNKYYPIKIQ